MCLEQNKMTDFEQTSTEKEKKTFKIKQQHNIESEQEAAKTFEDYLKLTVEFNGRTVYNQTRCTATFTQVCVDHLDSPQEKKTLLNDCRNRLG